MVKLTEARIRLICQQEDRGWVSHTPQTLSRNWGVSDRRIRQIAQKYRKTKRIPLLNPKRRPPGPPLSPEQEGAIQRVWERDQRGATNVYLQLRREGIHIPKHKIHAYMAKKGFSKPNPRKQKKRKRCRYEREYSGSLIHGDWHRTSEDHPHLILWLDDASRKVLFAAEFETLSTDASIQTLDAALANAAEWGLPVKQVLTDHGAVFFAMPQEGKRPGKSRFTKHLEDIGVQHILARVNNPQTNGKVERLFLEYDRHRWRFDSLEQWVGWNNDQIHSELWTDVEAGIFETPEEAFQRKLPPEVKLGLHFRLVESSSEVFS